MKFAVYLSIIVVALFTQTVYANQSGGGGGISTPQTTKRLTPEEKAAVSYNAGLKHSEKAAKFESQAANESTEKKLKKLQKKIAKQYNGAIKDYEKSIRHFDGFYESYSSLGYALRKVGRFEESLTAYNQALAINPRYGDAIEYRGEAYLGLNRLDEAKEAYMDLFQSEPALADQLMAAMVAWVEERRDNAGELDAEVVQQFAEWVAQRNTLASFIYPMQGTAQDRWADSS